VLRLPRRGWPARPILNVLNASGDSYDLHPVRLQFAWVIGWHILMPTFTVGMASYIAILECLRFVTGRSVYLRISTFWIRISGEACRHRGALGHAPRWGANDGKKRAVAVTEAKRNARPLTVSPVADALRYPHRMQAKGSNSAQPTLVAARATRHVWSSQWYRPLSARFFQSS
jgi:hypothetical protein